MSRLPETRREMERAKYVFKGARDCKNCGAAIEWWLTTNGKSMPFNAPAKPLPAALDEVAVVHWATCPNAKGQKGTGKPVETRTAAGSTVEDRFANVQRIAEQLGARLVLVLDDEGYTYANRRGLDPEDVKHELITAANEIRREMGAAR